MASTTYASRMRTASSTIFSNYVLNDREGVPADGADLEFSIQGRFFNDMTGLFLRRFSRIYASAPLSEDEKTRLRRQLERVFEAKDALDPGEPKGGMYMRAADR